MSLFSEMRERLGGLFFHRQRDEDMDEEIRFHLEQEAQARVRRGADAATARREAALAFGGVARYKEEVREARGITLVEQVAGDLRYAARALARNPGFTASVVAVLGLALGASGAVFSVADTVLLSELPYPDASRLVRISQENASGNRWGLSVADVMAIRDQQRSFTAFGAVSFAGGALTVGGTPQAITAGRATSGFFQALDIRPAVGRLISPDDEIAGAPPVAVITDELSRRGLGGPVAAVGQPVTVDGVSHTIVGVFPPGVQDLAGMRIGAWAPLVLRQPERRGPFGIRGFARLRSDITLEAAASDLSGMSERIFPIWSAGFRDRTAHYVATSLRESIVGTSSRQIVLFAGAVLLVLLVAVANVATLLLVRATARSAELSVRVALGAGRARLARLIASEGVVLTALSTFAGLGLAWAGIRVVSAVAPRLPRIAEVSLGPRAVGIVALLALISGVLVNLSPVASALSGRNAGSLQSDARRTGTSRRTNALRGGLVIAEFALALPLLLAAGLLLISFIRLERVDPGFKPEGAFAVRISLPAARYPDYAAVQRFWIQALARAGEVPTFTAVGASSGLPPDLFGESNNFDLVRHPVPAGGAEYVSPWSAASAGYFEALGIPLLEGRLFTPADSGNPQSDTTGAPPVVVVSRAWAAKYFPGESAVGQQLISGGCRDCRRTTVIGVVGDVKYSGLAGDGEGVYDPLAQTLSRGMYLVVRSLSSSDAAFARLRQQVGAIDPELPVVETSLTDQLRNSLADPRRWTGILGSFAGVALLLAALGIFGLMSYTVRQQHREIGVRLALGVEPASITRMVVRRGMRYAAIGTAIGFALATFESGWLGSLLYEVQTFDPFTLTVASAVLLIAAFGATWLPGWRAARIKPVEAMQVE